MERALRERWEERLGALAVRLVLLEERDLEEALRERDRTPGHSLAEILVERGLLSREDLEDLSDKLKEEEFAKAAPAIAIPSEVESALKDPLRVLAQFVLVSKLGSGGAAEVWKAWDRALGRWVAVKIPRFLPESKTAVERFKREAHAAAKLTHANIVPIYSVSEEGGRPFLVLQYVDGKTLAGEKLPPRQAAQIVADVSRAVDYAHAQGVIHRDVKPANLLLGTDGRPWIFDFGLVFLPEEGRHLTVPGTVIGTPAYMSPEQAEGGDKAHGPSTDVYGLGATLYDLSTGRAPFTGTSVADVLVNVRTGEAPSPRAIEPGLDPDLEQIIQKAMDREPRRRYASAAALAEDLGRYLAGEPVEARAPSLGAKLRKRARKHRAVLATGAVLLLAVALGISIDRRARSAAPGNPPLTVSDSGTTPEPVVLRAEDAVLHGPTLALYDTGPKRHVAGWNSRDCSLEWFVNAPKAGWYKVELTYATGLNNGGKYVLKTEQDEWSGNIASTGAWDAYRTISLGTISLPKDKSRLILGAKEVSGGLMDFKELRLTPERR